MGNRTRLPLPEHIQYAQWEPRERYTAEQLRAYSDAENAALREQVRVLRDALYNMLEDGDKTDRAQALVALEKTT